MVNGLIIAHSGERCGVYQFGRNLFETLKKNGGISWSYRECGSGSELQDAMSDTLPDLVLFNHHPLTMPWLKKETLPPSNAVRFGLVHSVTQDIVDRAEPGLFDFIIGLDPTLIPRNPVALRVPRFIPAGPSVMPPIPKVFTVGSFGFATPGKGFQRLCGLVNSEFDRAIVRINLPAHDQSDIVSAKTVEAVVEGCRAAITKPGIELAITHHFFENAQLVDFLAWNTINAFLDDDTPTTGISSVLTHSFDTGIKLSSTIRARAFFARIASALAVHL